MQRFWKHQDNEKNLSAFENQAATQVRLPETHTHQERTRHPARPAPQRPQTSFAGLTVPCPASEVRLDGSRTLPKQERLQHNYDFRRIYEQGRKTEGRLAVLYVLETARDAAGKRAVGFVTSRKVGNAVERNRARRLMRETWRLNKHRLKPDFEMVVVARAAMRGKSLQAVEEYLLAMFKAAGVLTET